MRAYGDDLSLSPFPSRWNFIVVEPQSFGDSYATLPWLYLTFLVIWTAAAVLWSLTTWRRRHFRTSNLQWVMASVPIMKALQLGLSFTFWNSCINFHICSLWLSFGVYATGIFFQTASFISFFLIAHGYCIMYENLSWPERRTTAILGCVLYLSLIGYKAAVPFFTVFLLLNYAVSFYVIFHHISRNLLVLREQLHFIQDEDMHVMHGTLHAKQTMFKRFHGAMQIVAATEILVYLSVDESRDCYWLRSMFREWAQFCIFLYIGWSFRTQSVSPHFSVIPACKSKWGMVVPPIYSIEMDAADFKDLASQEWQVGVPTSFPSRLRRSLDSMLVIVQQPRTASRTPEAKVPAAENRC